MRYICVDKNCCETYVDEEHLPENGRCVCGCEVDKLVACKWCGNDVALSNTYKGICDDCWNEDKENIEKELS